MIVNEQRVRGWAATFLLVMAAFGGQAWAQTPASAGALAELEKIAQGYEIDIISTEETMRINSSSRGIKCQVAGKESLEIGARLIASELALYPPSLVKRTRLKRLVLCKTLSIQEGSVGGTPDFRHDTIYLDISYSPNTAYLRETFHHELFHVIDYLDDGTLDSDARWEALNPIQFGYGGGGRSALHLLDTGNLTDRYPGFLNHYSTTGVEEDKAEVFANLIVNPAYVAERVRHDRVLQAKVDRMRALLVEFCPDMNDTFWESAERHAAENLADTNTSFIYLGRIGRLAYKLHRVTFSPDGKRIAAALENHAVVIWSSDGEEPIRVLRGHRAAVRDVAFSPDGKQILTGSEDKTAILWDAVTCEQLRTLDTPAKCVESVAFSPDGRLLAVGSYGVATLCDAQTGKQFRSLTALAGAPLAFSPDGSTLATVAPTGAVVLWDVQTGKRRRAFDWRESLADPDTLAPALAFSPDGQQIAIAARDKTVALWNVQSGEKLHTLSMPDFVTSLAYQPDGEKIMVGSLDGTAVIWDAQTGKQWLLLTGHTSGIRSAEFSRDGRFALTGSWDGTLGLWNAATGQNVLWLVSFNAGDDWLTFTSNGQYDGSDNGRFASRSARSLNQPWPGLLGEILLRQHGRQLSSSTDASR